MVPAAMVVQVWRPQEDHTTVDAEVVGVAAVHADALPDLRAQMCSRAPSHPDHADSSIRSEYAFPSPS